MKHYILSLVFLFYSSFLFAQSEIEVPQGAMIKVPPGAYLCAEKIIVDGNILFIPGDLCVTPNAGRIATILEASALNVDGLYGIGDEIEVTVTYSKEVSVTGLPLIALATDNPPSAAGYSDGSGSDQLIFTYIVKEGDNSLDLDYVSASALVLNNGTIRSLDQQETDNTLPLPGTVGSLQANKDIIVDGIFASVQNVNPKSGNTLPFNASPSITINFSEDLERLTVDLVQSHGDASFIPTLNGNILQIDLIDQLATSNATLEFKLDDITDLAGNVSPPLTISYDVAILADFNNDQKVNAQDLSVFVQNWTSKDLSQELGPVSGQRPFLTIVPDGKYDLSDIMAFTGMWHWSRKSNPASRIISNLGEEIVHTQDAHNVKISWGSDAVVAQLDFRYDPSIVSIRNSIAMDNMDLIEVSHSDSINGHHTYAFAQLGDNPQREKAFSMIIDSRLSQMVEVDYRLYAKDGELLSKGRKFIQVESVPTTYALYDNYPNPFNPETNITFALPNSDQVSLRIYNMLGQVVRAYDLSNAGPGYHDIRWDGTNDEGFKVGAGVYLYQLQTREYMKTKKMVLLK